MTSLLQVKDLTVRYGGSRYLAADSVSFSVGSGEVIGVVGESGSGKTTVGMALLGLLPASATVTGSVLFEGRDLLGMREDQLRRLRGSQISTIMQNASTALDPYFTIGSQFVELLRRHRQLSRAQARDEAIRWLQKVGIRSSRQHLRSYPHEFSGGMNQRVVIAMTLALNPKLVVADEPTSALDVTVQASVLGLLRTLRDESASGMVLITHDLGVVAQLCSQVIVMKSGSVVEAAAVDRLFADPRHEYTRQLLDSLPGRRGQRAPDTTAESDTAVHP
jgi:ABC-type dipeptide/oligopeptide/nickel transport system ATPase component